MTGATQISTEGPALRELTFPGTPVQIAYPVLYVVTILPKLSLGERAP